MLLERTGSPAIEPPPAVALGRDALNSGPGLSSEAELVGSSLFALEFGKPQSSDWC